MGDIADALKSVLARIGSFFDLFDLSFFVSGSVALSALHFWAFLAQKQSLFRFEGGNLIVFVSSNTTKLDPLRTALWTFAVVHAVPLLFIVLVAGANDPRFNLLATVIVYVVSFVFWATLHFAGRHRPPVYS